MGWHAIFVETGKEETVYTQINTLLMQSNYTDYELLIPKRKIKERHKGCSFEIIKKMFPGYILIKTSNPWYVYQKTRNLRSLYRFLSQDQVMHEIYLDEIANIIYMMDNQGVIGISDVYVETDKIVVTKGPLMNYEGIVKKIDYRNQRAKVLFMFDGNPHYINISVNILALQSTFVKKIYNIFHN